MSMSNHRDPTWLGVLDRALGDQQRTARLQALIITVACCVLVIAAAIAAVVALAGGHALLSLGLGSVPMLAFIGRKAWNLSKKSFQS